MPRTERRPPRRFVNSGRLRPGTVDRGRVASHWRIAHDSRADLAALLAPLPVAVLVHGGGMIEPLMIIFMGVVVGGIAASILLPIFRMSQSVH